MIFSFGRSEHDGRPRGAELLTLAIVRSFSTKKGVSKFQLFDLLIDAFFEYKAGDFVFNVYHHYEIYRAVDQIPGEPEILLT